MAGVERMARTTDAFARRRSLRIGLQWRGEVPISREEGRRGHCGSSARLATTSAAKVAHDVSRWWSWASSSPSGWLAMDRAPHAGQVRRSIPVREHMSSCHDDGLSGLDDGWGSADMASRQ